MIARHLVDDAVIRPCSEVVDAIGGRTLHPVGRTDVSAVLHGVPLQLADCLVLDSDRAVTDLIIGCDALEQHGLCIDVSRQAVTGRHVDGSQWTLHLPDGDRTSACAYFARATPCRATRDVTLRLVTR